MEAKEWPKFQEHLKNYTQSNFTKHQLSNKLEMTRDPKITHEPIRKIISYQLDIKLGRFMQEEFDSVLRKIKNRKATELDEISPEVWKTREYDDIL